MKKYIISVASALIFCGLITNAQVTIVKDLNFGFAGSYPNRFTNVNGTLYFVAYTPSEGYELWKSDGTIAGTVLLKDIYAGPQDASIFYLVSFNDTLYFCADDGINGGELWRSDGTTAGTIMVKDINSGSGGSNPAYLTVFNGAIYFGASGTGNGSELWKSDGTAAGTVLVKNIFPGFPEDLTDVNGTLFFRADDGANGKELWKSDGSSAGTVLVKDINPGAVGSGPIYTSPLTNVNGTLYFWASHVASGTELWKSDGTVAGTVMVKDIRPGSMSSLPSSNVKPIAYLGNSVFFPADDGTNGEELWVSDGTLSGTQLLIDIQPGASGSGAGNAVKLNNEIYFIAYGGSWEMWKSDGTTGGTSLVKSFSDLDYTNRLTNINNTLYFAASDGISGMEFWKSDGTALGTTMISDINPGPTNSYPKFFTNVNGSIFFNADDGASGQELWKYDSTVTGLSFHSIITEGITLSPNPFSSLATIKTDFYLENATLKVYNLSGQQVKQLLNINGKIIYLQRENLPPGLYFFQLIEGNKLNVTGKIVITED